MKKLFKSIYIFILSITLFLPFTLFCQLTGNYTIGGTNPDYSTVTAAVNALHSQGVSNSVVFNIRPGTYSEQITINSVSGVNASKTVTFQSENGDSTSVIITYPSSTTNINNFALKLNNTDYLIFKKITLERSGSNSYSQIVDISGGATYNKFQNCKFVGNTASSSAIYSALVGSNSNADDSYNEFISNLFEGGSYGLYYLGRGSTMLDFGLVINNNIFNNQYYRAMHLSSQSSPQITGNQINAIASSSSYQAIYAFYCDNSLRILKNKINITNGGYALYIHNSSGASTEKGLIANNFISLGGNAESYGIYINLSSAQHIYYNSINLYSNNSNSKILNINGVTTANIDIRNNNFFSSGDAYAIYVSDNTINPVSACDYNNLFTNGNFIAFWKSIGNIADLNAWQTASGFDGNSVSTDPLYVSVTDLHAQSGSINNLATPSLSSATPVNNDIDNQLRSSSTPDIGADEFFVEDLGVSSVIVHDTVCINSNSNVQIYIKNYGSYTFSGSVPIYFKYSSEPFINASTSISNLNPNDSILYSFTTYINHTQAGQNTIIAGTNFNNDININNDECSVYKIFVKDLPLINISNDTIICNGDSVMLTVSGGLFYNWSNGNTSEHFFVKPNNDTIYYVTVTDNYACNNYDSVKIELHNSLPVISDFSINTNGLFVTLSNNSINADNYLWLFGNGNTDTLANPPTFFYPDSGSYDITLYSYNTCYSDSNTQSIYVNKINEYIDNFSFLVYPNPATDYIEIDFESFKNDDFAIFIKAVDGSIIQKLFKDKINSNLKIDVSDLSKGYYIIEVISDTYIGKQAFIKL